MVVKLIVLLSLAIVVGNRAGCASEAPVLRHTGSMVSHVDLYGSGTGVSERLNAAGQMGVGFKYGDPSKTSWKGNIRWSLLLNEGNADIYAFELEFIPEGGAPVRQIGKLSFDGESPSVVVVNDQWAISIEPEQPQRPEK